jgi:hypothetical protein
VRRLTDAIFVQERFVDRDRSLCALCGGNNDELHIS